MYTERYEQITATQFYDSKKSISDNTLQQKIPHKHTKHLAFK